MTNTRTKSAPPKIRDNSKRASKPRYRAPTAAFNYGKVRFTLHGGNATGKPIKTITAIAFRELGAYDGTPFTAKDLSRYFQSRRALTHHQDKGNIKSNGDGTYNLTAQGIAHFSGRLTGSNVSQAVGPDYVKMIERLMVTGKPPVGLNLDTNTYQVVKIPAA